MHYQTYETQRCIYTYRFYCDSNTNCKRKHLNNNTVIQITVLNVLSRFPKYCNALINYMLANSLFAIHQKMKDIPRAFFQFSSKTLTIKFISVWKTLIPAAIKGLNVTLVKSYKMEQIQTAKQIRK